MPIILTKLNSYKKNNLKMSDEIDLNIDITHYNECPSFLDIKTYMNILYLNARSLRNSLEDLEIFLTTLNYIVHVVVITETWLDSGDIAHFNLPNYHSFHSVRKFKTGGGVAIFLHESFDNANIVFEKDFDNNNALIIALIKNKCKIAAFYRQPNNPNDYSTSKFVNIFEQLLTQHSNMYVIGDFNLNLLEQTQATIRYQNAYSLNSFCLLNEISEIFPTRVSNNAQSAILDHVLTDTHLFNKDLKYSFYLFDLLADHRSILLNIQKNKISKNNMSRLQTLRIVNHDIITKRKLLFDLKPTNFVNYLTNISQIINKNSKLIKLNKKRNKPYINDNIRELIIIRNNYCKLKMKLPQYEYAHAQYKLYRNKITHLVKQAKKEYVDKYFQNNCNDPRKTWSQLKQLLYNSNVQAPNCELLVDNGIPITNEKHIADKFNHFFTTHTNIITSQITINDEDFHTFHAKETYDILFPFTCPQITEDEISLIIANLKNSNATDYYGLSNNFVKIHKNHLACNLTKLVNESMFSGSFPDCLKVGVVSAVFKKGNKTDKLNYRPITILPIFAKIFEYAILRRLESHLDINKVLNKNQFGYSKGSNTEIAMVHILNTVYRSIDSPNPTALTCLDLSRAFDCLQHDILLNKIRKLQLNENFYKLIISYLNQRKQVVKLNNTISQELLITCGTPQGGVLSGLFFNLYINNIASIDTVSSIFLYCDDLTLITTANDPISLKSNIENDLLSITQWLKYHYLLVNESKTKMLLFHNKRRQEFFTVQSLNIQLNGKLIERVDHLKLLGLELDETLSFSNHIKAIQLKIVPFSFALRRIRKYLSGKTALMLYHAYVQSHLMYMNVIWSAAPKYLIESLEIIQRKTLRVIFNKPWYCSKSELYSLNILPVSQLGQVSTLLLVFKMSNSSAKNNFTFQYMHENHSYNTRNNDIFVIDIMSTQLSTQNFYIRGPKDFNNLPAQIRNQRAFGIFKRKIREFLFNSISL